jgi:uncharacterized coiled-coil DUF342 family protein
MNIDKDTLIKERETLKQDFDAINEKIRETEKGLLQLKNNLNAVYGAIQQTDKLIKLTEGETADDKKDAVAVATS